MLRSEAIARRVLREMKLCTQRGWPRPWATKGNLRAIVELLDEVDDEEVQDIELELLEHVRGAAELVAAGAQSPRYWNPGNLFGPKTFERWRADIEAHRSAIEESEKTRRRIETRRSAEDSHGRPHADVIPIPMQLPESLAKLVEKHEKSTGSRFIREEDPQQLGLPLSEGGR